MRRGEQEVTGGGGGICAETVEEVKQKLSNPNRKVEKRKDRQGGKGGRSVGGGRRAGATGKTGRGRCSPGGLRTQKVALPRHFPGRCLSPIPFHISHILADLPLSLSLPLDSDSLEGYVPGAGEREEVPHEITRARHYALADEEAHGNGTQHGLSTARLWRQARVLATCSPPGMNSSPGSRFPLGKKRSAIWQHHTEKFILSRSLQKSQRLAPRGPAIESTGGPSPHL